MIISFHLVILGENLIIYSYWTKIYHFLITHKKIPYPCNVDWFPRTTPILMDSIFPSGKHNSVNVGTEFCKGHLDTWLAIGGVLLQHAVPVKVVMHGH